MPTEFELIPGRRIGGQNPCFVIAEIGQNHQGDVQIAIELIKRAKVSLHSICIQSCIDSKFNSLLSGVWIRCSQVPEERFEREIHTLRPAEALSQPKFLGTNIR